MLSSEVTRPALSAKLAARIAAIALGAALLAGCQAQPLYGNLSGETRSVTVSRVDSRIEQVVSAMIWCLALAGNNPQVLTRLI
jgi:LPS-assembly lipoprotein